MSKINNEIRLHREEAHLAGRIEEAQSIRSSYTKQDGPTSILNSVLDKRLKKYRKKLQNVFSKHKDQQSPPNIEGEDTLRKELQDMVLEIGRQVTDAYVIKNGLWEGISIQNQRTIDKFVKRISKHQATIERNARIDELKKLRNTGQISSFVEDAFIIIPAINRRLAYLNQPNKET